MSTPYFRFYPTDFEADTSHLTLIEDGAYNRLLRLCWMTPGCSLPDDEAWIFRRCRAHSPEEQEAIRTVLSEFFRVENQRVFNNRLLREFDSTSHRREMAVENGKKGGRPKAPLKTNEKAKPDGLNPVKLKKANQNQNQNQNITDTYVSDGDAVDIRKSVWERGVPFLVNRGTPETQARSLLGKWLKSSTPAEVFAALSEASSAKTGDPVPYITEVLKGHEKPSREAARLQAFIAGAVGET